MKTPDPPSQTLPNFEQALQDLHQLNIPDPDLEALDEISVTSSYAYDEAFARQYFPNTFPKCRVILSTTGGVILVWNNRDSVKEVRVTIKPTSKFWA